MGKTVVKHEDVEKLYEMTERIANRCFGKISHDNFIAAVEEVFGVTLPIESEKEQSLEEMCSQITDENRPELVDFGKPVGKEVI